MAVNDNAKNVAQLDDYRPHVMTEVICVKCHYRAVATYPERVMLRDIICGGCGETQGLITTGCRAILG